ncbi:unnamed protein product [Camellia sinensis]
MRRHHQLPAHHLPAIATAAHLPLLFAIAASTHLPFLFSIPVSSCSSDEVRSLLGFKTNRSQTSTLEQRVRSFDGFNDYFSFTSGFSIGIKNLQQLKLSQNDVFLRRYRQGLQIKATEGPDSNLIRVSKYI